MAQDLGVSLDTARKLNDCYFYYYSTCTKGDNCVFRHEPSALGCETMCAAWQQGKCLDKKCKLRHMELRKNRKQIPCYWESQPCGCRKKHCPFMHRNPEARTDGIAPSQMNAPTGAGPATTGPVERAVCEAPMVPAVGGIVPGAVPARVPTASVQPTVASVPLMWQREINRSVMLDSGILGVLPASTELMGARPPAPNYAAVPVDSLVVNFDEESDCDSVQSTPKKAVCGIEDGEANEDELKVLERIQAEAAAYYSYSGEKTKDIKTHSANTSLDFKILSLDEIRARKKSVDSHTPTNKYNRKRKSSQETIVDSENKIIKLVRSTSIVYKKVDNAPAQIVNKQDIKQTIVRTRTQSEQSDFTEKPETELLDCDTQFTKIETEIHTIKPILIMTRHSDSVIDIDKTNDKSIESNVDSTIISTDLNSTSSELYSSVECETIELDAADSDTEVQVIEDVYKNIEEIDCTSRFDPVVVDLCEGDDEEIVEMNNKNFPDVVTSCQSNVSDAGLSS